MFFQLFRHLPLRVQVSNNHILTPNLYYNYHYPNPKYQKYWVHGPLGYIRAPQASCTIEASARIYACRVDCVHTDTYRVLGGLNSADVAPWASCTLRVQILNHHILTQTLYYNSCYPKTQVPNYWGLGP